MTIGAQVPEHVPENGVVGGHHPVAQRQRAPLVRELDRFVEAKHTVNVVDRDSRNRVHVAHLRSPTASGASTTTVTAAGWIKKQPNVSTFVADVTRSSRRSASMWCHPAS